MPVEMERSSTSSSEMNADSALPEPQGVGPLGQKLSRRSLVARATFFGTAMAALGDSSQGSGRRLRKLQQCRDCFAGRQRRRANPRGANPRRQDRARHASGAARYHGARDGRRDGCAGPHANVLRKGANDWVCMPGDEDVVGDPPMCVDALGMQWFKDLREGAPEPTNKAPGLCYMLCGATQHSNTTPHDRTSPAIPIGPHWMILWPFDADHCGLPTTVRDAGAWIMFAGTPYAYLHVCGTPWAGNEYAPGDEAIWTMRYQKRTPG